MATGRKKIEDLWREDNVYETKLNAIRGMARHGVSQVNVAAYLGISHKTFVKMLSKTSTTFNQDVYDAMNRGNADLYFGSIADIVAASNDEEIDIDYRIELKKYLIKKYDHRYITDLDKEILEAQRTKELFKMPEDAKVFILNRGESDGGNQSE